MEMRKMFIGLVLASLISSNTVMAGGFPITPTAGNRNVYPIMQYQMEKEETLDFANHPEQYKKKRAEKDARLDYIEGKTDVNPYKNGVNPTINQNGIMPVNMQFTQDGNGQIKIQGIK